MLPLSTPLLNKLFPYSIRNHPKQAGLTWPKKKKSQGIILAISCRNKATSL